MHCPHCGATNRDDAAFCRHCGRLLLAACPRCAAAAAPDANFCDACGSPLSPHAWTGTIADNRQPTADRRPPHAPSPNVTAAPAHDPDPSFPLDRFIPRELLTKLTAASGATAERRVVTLLFCDLKGSTAFAEQLDPEEWTEIINGAFEQMVRPVYKYEGTVARLMGDGLLAFFGAPIAHEDDPRRAVLAGLAIVDGIRAYRAGLPPAAADLDVRVGINTGLVVVGAVGSDLRLEYSAIGDAINLAARMEQTAAPGTVRIAEDTYRLVAGQFEVEPLGPVEVKGKARPVTAYQVLGRAMDAGRRRIDTHRPITRLVDRRAEWDALRGAFADLAAGRGGIVFLTGDAGLGKSRLIDEATAQLLPAHNPPGRLYDAAAVSYETNQPYGLLTRLLRRPLELAAGDTPETIRDRIAAAHDLLPDPADRLVLEMLFGATGAESPDLTGEAFAHRLDEALDRLLTAATANGPLVLALDDLQWLDASSAEHIGRLFALTERLPVLFLCALRRDRAAPGWALKEAAGRDLPHRLIELTLRPLDPGDTRALLAELLGAIEPPDVVAAPLLEKAEGNPLFLEEVVHHLIERGDLIRGDDGAWAAAPGYGGATLPGSIQALLTARIDRLMEDTRRTLQVAAVIGRFFPRSPLAALVDRPDALERQLLDLQRMELIREVSRVPEPGYLFNHPLTHEATYNTILLKQRRQMHRRVAEVIESLRGDNSPSATAPVLAHHFLEGDAPERALPYLQMAAADALRLHATVEAIAFYDRALPIARDTAAGAPHLAAIAAARGRALELQSRFHEADAAYAEMEQLSLERNDPALELEMVLARGKLRANVTPLHDPVAGRALMERAMALAEQTGNRVAEVRILWNLVNIGRFQNQFDDAIARGERGVALARELGLEEELAYLLNDLGDTYGPSGQVDRAIAMLDEAQSHWRALGNLPMLADSLTSGAVYRSITGDFQQGLELVEESFALTSRISNIWGEAYSQNIRGLILCQMGELDRGLSDLATGIEKCRIAGFIGGEMLASAFLARILLELGDAEGAIARARAGLDAGRELVPHFAGMCIGCIVSAEVRLGNLDAAAAIHNDPLLHQEERQIFIEYDVALAGIELALATGRTNDALRLADEAVMNMEALGARPWLAAMLLARSHALHAAGRLDEAAEAAGAAVELARALNLHGALWQNLLGAAAIAAARGDDASAAALRAEAASEIDVLASRIRSDDLRATFLNRAAVTGIGPEYPI